MDLKQLEYIIQIAKEQNITRAAGKLYITQSALNQQLLKLEKELGTELFHRVRNGWQLTKAGQIYVDAAKQILSIKKDTYNKIFDIATQKKGTLSIGFSSERGTSMFSSVYPHFHEIYPDILIQPNELNVTRQQELVADKTIDIGFVTLQRSQRHPGLIYENIAHEEIFLAVPAALKLPVPEPAGHEHAAYPELPLSLLRSEPFVLMYKQSTNRPLVDSLFAQAGFSPSILFETSSTYTILTMIESNLCCGFIPGNYVKKMDNIRFYSLPSHPTWDVACCYHKNAYLSQAAREFILLASEYWQHTGVRA